MPGGVSWPRYLLFCAAAALTTLAGSHVVHDYYKPLDDLEELVQKEIERRKQAQNNKPG